MPKLPSSSQRPLRPYKSTDQATALETMRSLRTQLQDEARLHDKLDDSLAKMDDKILDLKDSLREIRRVRARPRRDDREAVSWEGTCQHLEDALRIAEKEKNYLTAQLRETETREDELERQLWRATTAIEVNRLREENRRLLCEPDPRRYQRQRRRYPNETVWIIGGSSREDRRPRTTTTYYSMPRRWLWPLI
jgi:predicted RNase H-like nuclease (RuvC/YqgF family)